MASPDSKDDWQDVFDTDFPNGMVLTWDRPHSPHYLIPRIEVAFAVDAKPVVQLDVFDAHKSFVIKVLGYTVVARDPALARVVGHNLDDLMLWSGAITLP